jgi:hypothetical protein
VNRRRYGGSAVHTDVVLCCVVFSVVLCCVVLCCVQCCVVLCSVLCCVVFSVVLCCVVLYCVVFSVVLCCVVFSVNVMALRNTPSEASSRNSNRRKLQAQNEHKAVLFAVSVSLMHPKFSSELIILV